MEDRSPVSATLARIRAGDRRALARSITEVDCGTPAGVALLEEIGACHHFSARVIGVTGPPGAGKSTLVNALALELLARDKTVAILAVDPSSPLTGGAVLGDRIRMRDVHADPRVFVRSLAARGHLGGLTRTAGAVVSLVAAAGFDVVIVETVGTGQSEIEVVGVADTTVVVCPPGLGDDVQAAKAGVLEIADVLVVSKGDVPAAEGAERELRAMLALRRPERRPPVVRTSAASNEGVPRLADLLLQQSGPGPEFRQ